MSAVSAKTTMSAMRAMRLGVSSESLSFVSVEITMSAMRWESMSLQSESVSSQSPMSAMR